MAKTNIVGWQGPSDQTQTYTTSADMSTAAAISPAPETGKKLLVDGVTIGIGSVAGEWFLQEETSATVFASGFGAANSTVHLPYAAMGLKFKLAVADKKLFGKGPAGNIRFTVWNRSET